MAIDSAQSSSGEAAKQTTPPEVRLDHALISLNNTAIILIQRNDFKGAIAIFKDALSLLKSRTQPSFADTAMGNARRKLDERYHEANRDVVVLETSFDPREAYDMLNTLRTSKVCLTLDGSTQYSLHTIQSMLVYNYGVAHRLCPCNSDPRKMIAFCLQIFQYAETLMPSDCNNLLFKLVLTRNLMMLACRLGMSLCEHYKETLDPIVDEICGRLQEPQFDENQAPAA